MNAYRFINADHSLVVTPDGYVIAWDAKANAPSAHQVGGPPLQPVRKPPNERDEPFDNREHQARASLLPATPAIEPPDEMKLWKDAGSPMPTADAQAAAAAATFAALPPLANTMTMAIPERKT